MTNNVSGNFVDIAFFMAKPFPLLSVKASTFTFRFFSLPWPHIFTAINVAKSSSLSKDSGVRFICLQKSHPETSRCLLQELKVGPPSSKKLLLSALSWMVALPPPVSSLLFSTNLSTMSPRSSSKGVRHPQTLLLHLLSLQLSPQASSLNLPILVLGIFSWRKAISPANIFSTIFQSPLLSTILQECGDDCFCGGHAADAAVPR